MIWSLAFCHTKKQGYQVGSATSFAWYSASWWRDERQVSRLGETMSWLQTAVKQQVSGIQEPGEWVAGQETSTSPLNLFLSNAYSEKKHNLGDKGSEKKNCYFLLFKITMTVPYFVVDQVNNIAPVSDYLYQTSAAWCSIQGCVWGILTGHSPWKEPNLMVTLHTFHSLVARQCYQVRVKYIIIIEEFTLHTVTFQSVTDRQTGRQAVSLCVCMRERKERQRVVLCVRGRMGEGVKLLISGIEEGKCEKREWHTHTHTLLCRSTVPSVSN